MRSLVVRVAVAVVAVVFAGALAAGCAHEGNCEAVVDKTIELVAAEAGDDAAREAAREKMASERDDMVKKCRAEDLSKSAEACALAAPNLEALAACDSK